LLTRREPVRTNYKIVDLLLIFQISAIDFVYNLGFTGLGDVVGGYPIMVFKRLCAIGKLGLRFVGMRRDLIHGGRVYSLERLFHILGGKNALVVVDQNYVH